MTTKTLSRLESFPMIPKFIKKRLVKKTEMDYWSGLCGIVEKKKSFIKKLSMYRISKLTRQLDEMEKRVNELEEKIETFNGIFQKEESEEE